MANFVLSLSMTNLSRKRWYFKVEIQLTIKFAVCLDLPCLEFTELERFLSLLRERLPPFLLDSL